MTRLDNGNPREVGYDETTQVLQTGGVAGRLVYILHDVLATLTLQLCPDAGVVLQEKQFMVGAGAGLVQQTDQRKLTVL
nr:hypothetical protein BaRGS_002060 [Batillaria attramentaria]